MSFPLKYNLELYKDRDYEKSFLIQQNSLPLNLTGYAGKAEVRLTKADTGTPLATFTVAISAPETGRVVISLTKTQVNAITIPAGKQAFWDLMLTTPAPDSKSRNYVEGSVYIKDTVTIS